MTRVVMVGCNDGLQELSKLSIKCSIVGLAAELKLCKTITQRTQG